MKHFFTLSLFLFCYMIVSALAHSTVAIAADQSGDISYPNLKTFILSSEVQIDSIGNLKSNESINNPIEYVRFTLHNSSKESIPLIIPTVMKPNLSPESNSAVTLRIGQEIFFKAKGKKRLLLVVDRTIQNGDVIDVVTLLAKRKKELGIKR